MPIDLEKYLDSHPFRFRRIVPANIAEGYQRGTRKDYANFISIARGSLAETETFLVLATRTGLLSDDDVASALNLADEASRMLFALRQKLKETPNA